MVDLKKNLKHSCHFLHKFKTQINECNWYFFWNCVFFSSFREIQRMSNYYLDINLCWQTISDFSCIWSGNFPIGIICMKKNLYRKLPLTSPPPVICISGSTVGSFTCEQNSTVDYNPHPPDISSSLF